jgi:hypothetical protein
MTKKEALVALSRGEGAVARAQDDEPVFILMARDVLAASVVREYARAAMRFRGLVPEAKLTDKLAEVHRVADAMDEWRSKNWEDYQWDPGVNGR